MSTNSQLVCLVGRHGTTTLNQAGCFRGPLDVDLDQAGIHVAHQQAAFLTDYDLYPVIFCSPKKRARHTAKIIQETTPKYHVVYNDALAPLNVGDLGGKKKTPETGRIVLEHVENPDVPFPGGESLNNFRNRVRPLLRDAIKLGITTGRPPLLEAHSSIIREVGFVLHPEQPEKVLVKPGGIIGIFIENGKLDARPIFKPDINNEDKAFVVS